MKTQQEIEKEFDEIFNHNPDRLYENLKSFIRQLRQDDIKSLIEWVEEKHIEGNFDAKTFDYVEAGYRLAISDLISHLHSQLKELN